MDDKNKNARPDNMNRGKPRNISGMPAGQRKPGVQPHPAKQNKNRKALKKNNNKFNPAKPSKDPKQMKGPKPVAKTQPVNPSVPVKGKRPEALHTDVKRPAGQKPVDPKQKNRPADKAQTSPIHAKSKTENLYRQQKEKEKVQKKVEQKLEKAEKQRKKEKEKKLSSRKNAERKALRNGLLGAVAVSLALFVLAFVIFHLYSYIAEKPRFAFVSNGSVEHTIGARGLIIRNESVLNTSANGELVTKSTEGSRAAKGQTVALVVPKDMASTVENLRNVQSQISEVQQELIAKGSVSEAKTVYDKYNENLNPIIDLIRLDAINGNMSDLSSYSSSLTVLLDERETTLSQINFNDERLSELRKSERNYETQLENSSSKIITDRPGIISFRLDGLETTLPFNNFLKEDMNTVKDAIKKSTGAITSDLIIDSGDNVARIAQNELQYIAVYLSNANAQAADFAVGTLHDINVPAEGLSIADCEVVRNDTDNNGMLIVFKTARYVEDLLDYRTADIEIVISLSQGMKVNSGGLVNADLSNSNGFCVLFPKEAGMKAESFKKDGIFNINVLPEAAAAPADGEKESKPANRPDSISVPAAKVVHTEQFEDGSLLVGFSTANEFANFLKVNQLYTDGYKAVFIDTNTGLGTDAKALSVYGYSGIASIYWNNQGFVNETRVIVSDYDREFAIIRPIGDAKEPDLDTVMIVNPKSCKPGDKVG